MDFIDEILGFDRNDCKDIPGCEYKYIKFLMKDGSERQGLLTTNKAFPALKQYSYVGGHPLSNSVVDFDLVDKIIE